MPAAVFNLQDTSQEVHERQDEQEKDIIERYQEFQVEIRQANYGTITI